jgi:hypothetical protein
LKRASYIKKTRALAVAYFRPPPPPPSSDPGGGRKFGLSGFISECINDLPFSIDVVATT